MQYFHNINMPGMVFDDGTNAPTDQVQNINFMQTSCLVKYSCNGEIEDCQDFIYVSLLLCGHL